MWLLVPSLHNGKHDDPIEITSSKSAFSDAPASPAGERTCRTHEGGQPAASCWQSPATRRRSARKAAAARVASCGCEGHDEDCLQARASRTAAVEVLLGSAMLSHCSHRNACRRRNACQPCLKPLDYMAKKSDKRTVGFYKKLKIPCNLGRRPDYRTVAGFLWNPREDNELNFALNFLNHGAGFWNFDPV